MLVKTTSGSVCYKGQYHVAGGEPFDMDAPTAARLIALGVVAEMKDEELDAMTAPTPAEAPVETVAASSASDPEPVATVAASPFGDASAIEAPVVTAPKRTRKR